MTTYKFLAPDSASAMEEVVKKLGPDALIVSTSKRGNKVEIEATDTIPKQQLSNPAVEGGNFSDILHSKIDVLREKQRDRIYNRSNSHGLKANFNSNKSEENNFSELLRVKDQINELQSMLSGMVITDERSLNEKAGNSVPLKLRQLEFSPYIISMLRPAFDGLNLERGKAAFLKAFSKRIGCDEVNEVLKSKVIFIVGPSGVGKTTLAAKLTARIMEDNDALKPALVSTESQLTNKKDDLSHYSKLLNVQKFHYKLDQDIDDFNKICDDQKIVDMGSVSEENKNFIQNIRNKIGATKVATILCLPTGGSKQFIESQINIYGELKPLVAFTKADECKLYPRELCVLSDRHIKMGFITGSKTILGSLAISDPDVLSNHLESYLSSGFENE